MEHLLEMVQLVSSHRFFYLDFLVLHSTKPQTYAESITLKKQELPPPPDPTKIDYYKNFDELCKRVTKLSLPSYWKINCSNIVHLYVMELKTNKFYHIVINILFF